jgi:hypothetical protein
MKSKVGLAAAKSAALRINLNVEVCCIVTAPVHAPDDDDDFFYLFLQKQKSAQSYLPQGYFPPYETV